MFTLSGCFLQSKDEKIPVQVLIIPKFEVGENAGDFPGEDSHEELLRRGQGRDRCDPGWNTIRVILQKIFKNATSSC